jgi:hypothetical protein
MVTMPGDLVVRRRYPGPPHVVRADDQIWITATLLRDAARRNNPWCYLAADGGRLIITGDNGTWTYAIDDPVPDYPGITAAHLVETT